MAKGVIQGGVTAHGQLSRRGFVGGTAAAAGMLALPGTALAATRRIFSPSDRVNVAVIGAGGMGASNMSKLVSQNIVALADVDFEHVGRSLRNREGVIPPERQSL